jgi:hypothetical protein
MPVTTAILNLAENWPRTGRKMWAETRRKDNLFYFSAPIFLPGVVSQAASPAQTENCCSNEAEL